jgi:hypothetical protein
VADHIPRTNMTTGRKNIQTPAQTIPTELSPQTNEQSLPSGKRMSRRYRVMVAASVVWFPLYLMLLPLLVLVPDPPPASIVLLMVAGNLAWLVAAYCIYDALFGLAQARWPAARVIREIVGPLLKSFVPHHHSS